MVGTSALAVMSRFEQEVPHNRSTPQMHPLHSYILRELTAKGCGGDCLSAAWLVLLG